MAFRREPEKKSCDHSQLENERSRMRKGTGLFVRICLKVMRQVFRADKLHLRVSERLRICLGACDRRITGSREQKDLICFRVPRVIEHVHLARPFVHITGVISPFNKPAKVGVAQRGRTMRNEC